MGIIGAIISLAFIGVILIFAWTIAKDFIEYMSKNSGGNTSTQRRTRYRKPYNVNQYRPGWKWNETTQQWEPPEQKEKQAPQEEPKKQAEQKPEEQKKEHEEIDYKNSYQARYIFTKNEYHNFKKLRDIAEIKGYVVLPKIRLSDIITPRRGEKKYQTLLNKVQSKHVDFVICDKDMYIKAIVELDDSSHDAPKRIERDQFVDLILKSVGYKVIHTRYINYDILDLI